MPQNLCSMQTKRSLLGKIIPKDLAYKIATFNHYCAEFMPGNLLLVPWPSIDNVNFYVMGMFYDQEAMNHHYGILKFDKSAPCGQIPMPDLAQYQKGYSFIVINPKLTHQFATEEDINHLKKGDHRLLANDLLKSSLYFVTPTEYVIIEKEKMSHLGKLRLDTFNA